jgi:hypothetical protein
MGRVLGIRPIRGFLFFYSFLFCLQIRNSNFHLNSNFMVICLQNKYLIYPYSYGKNLFIYYIM